MANPTTNYGWVMPTSTDLVTDLPADFAVFGQAVDTSLADLKGGTTGQVLAKATATDMDFTWVTTDDTNAIQNAIVDAKGDLIAASGADTPARLAVGNNGETLVADSSATTGLRYTAGTVTDNPFLNSAMQVWQRGTSISLAASAGTTFLADRWCIQTGASQATTVSRQVTGDTTNLPFIQYAMRIQRNSGQTGTSNYGLMSPMETINTVPFAGKAVTFSFYARKGANYSATSDVLRGILRTGTGTDQNPYTGYTGDANSLDANFTLTTSWQRFSVSGTLAATVTEMTAQFNYTPTGTAGAADYYDITGVQLDIGSVALPFRTNGGTFQGELAACQRYYYQWQAAGNYSPFGVGFTQGTTLAILYKAMPVVMRTTPTITTTGTAANYAVMNGNTGRIACSAVPVINQGNPDGLILDWAATGLTAGGAIEGNANNTTAAYVGFSAEL